MDIDRLAQMIADVLSVDPREVTMDTTFMEDLGADSLDIFQIVNAIEEEYQITLPEEKVSSLKTVREALELINELKK